MCFFLTLIFAGLHDVFHHCYPLIYVCLCYWLPVRGVCPNYEVVEFQPRKVTPTKPMLCPLLLIVYS